MRRSLFVIVTMMGTAFAGQHAPLPPALMQAKTVYIDNEAGRAAFADKCYQELTKWGRFKVVSDPKSADVIFRITSMTAARVCTARPQPVLTGHMTPERMIQRVPGT